MQSSTLSAKSSSTLPTQIGGYQIEELLGEGAAGIVYRARRSGDHGEGDTDQPALVALKVLKPAAATQPQVLACFQFEGRILSRLSHPGILRVYETGLDDGQMFTAMELIDGFSFDKYLLAKKKLSVRLSIRLARQLAEALDYLHSHGYVHRDIKPANLMCDAAGRLLLFDFGTVIRTKDGIDYEAGIYGTPAFAAPEQIENRGLIDGRADLYALGIMLYLMVTGRKPFYGTREDVLQAHLTEIPKPPSKYARVPQALEAVILQAIAKEPADRFATGADFAAALTEVEENLPPVPPSAWQRFLGWLRPTSS
ncbi:MAG: serine/threonine protein kinase [Caldilineaceae bacterium]|nr:serine/threonine protein kinase [Caldilineaceae bacterium]